MSNEHFPAGTPVHAIAARLADDGGFQCRKAELNVIRTHLQQEQSFHQTFSNWTEDSIRRSHKAGAGNGPRASVDESLRQAADMRKQLKSDRVRRTAEVGKVVSRTLERALQCAQIAYDLAVERETSCAEMYGVEFVPSRTLQALERAIGLLREHAALAKRLPDLLDIAGTCRLLGIDEATTAVADE